MEKALAMDARDNVATAIVELGPGEVVSLAVGSEALDVKIREAIRFGHKFAIRSIQSGDEVVKYGEAIGCSMADIHEGQHVHIHNVESMRGRGGLA